MKDLNRLLEEIKPYTALSKARLETLKRLSGRVNYHGIVGDFVECGTWRGGSAAWLAAFILGQRHLWIYDNFQGLPEPSEIDGPGAKKWIGKCRGSEDEVRKVLELSEISPEGYTIRGGDFEDTFKDPLPSRVALLHCDADWHRSTLLALKTFYPRIPEGGCVVLDDFGHWEGCREAFYDFCSEFNVKPLLERVGREQAYWIKGRRNNRTKIQVVGRRQDGTEIYFL